MALSFKSANETNLGVPAVSEKYLFLSVSSVLEVFSENPLFTLRLAVSLSVSALSSEWGSLVVGTLFEACRAREKKPLCK